MDGLYSANYAAEKKIKTSRTGATSWDLLHALIVTNENEAVTRGVRVVTTWHKLLESQLHSAPCYKQRMVEEKKKI